MLSLISKPRNDSSQKENLKQEPINPERLSFYSPLKKFHINNLATSERIDVSGNCTIRENKRRNLRNGCEKGKEKKVEC